ncbi:MAG TPA: response regulator [Verrucomicrobiae bacterium]
MKQSILCFTSQLCVVDAKSTPNWEIRYAANTEHAFQALASQPFEAVATDTEHIGRDSTVDKDFLRQVMARFPNPARLLLYNPTDTKSITSHGGVIHQCLTLPTSADLLISAAQRARFVTKLLGDTAIKNLLPSLRKLPSVPSVYFRVVEALKLPESDVNDIGIIMAEEPMMTAKLLQVANSAYFALQSSVTSPSEAISYLGLEKTKALILIAHVFSTFEAEKQANFSAQHLWQHSLTVAQYARLIAKYETGQEDIAQAAYSAGLLHDLGKFILAANCPQKYNQILEQAFARKITFAEAEQAVLGTTHAEIAACILGTWGLPACIVEALAYHHYPARSASKDFTVTTAVHVADVLSHLANKGKEGLKTLAWDMEYLDQLGMAHRLETWKETCNQVKSGVRIAA